jgi:hypothetical protein
MEAADLVGNTKKLRQLANSLQSKSKRTQTTINTDESGTPLTTEEQRLAVFKRYFQTKFDPAPPLPIDVTPISIDPLPNTQTQPSITIDPPILAETIMAIKTLATNKAVGIDEIPIELFQHSPEATAELHGVVVEVFVEEISPDDWSQGLFVNIYKGKESKNQPLAVSYRPICLLCHAYKVFAVILLKRLQQWIDVRIKEGQEGFRQGRGCRDNLHVLRAAINY